MHCCDSLRSFGLLLAGSVTCVDRDIEPPLMWQRIALLQAEKEGKECARLCRELKDSLKQAQDKCAALETEVPSFSA